MTNPRNHGHVIGRIARNIVEYPNEDGSKTLAITIAAADNYKRNGRRSAQFIPLRAYIPNHWERNPWESLSVGSLVAVNYWVDTQSYLDKNGERKYPLDLVVQGFPQFL